MARSARTASWVAGRFSRDTASRERLSSARISIPSAPCPTAGHIWSNVKYEVICSVSTPAGERRLRPRPGRRSHLAQACAVACRDFPASPHTSDRDQCVQLRLPPRTAGGHTRPREEASQVTRPSREISTSRASSRGGTAPRISPSGCTVGKSFKLCTATSIARASTIGGKCQNEYSAFQHRQKRSRHFCSAGIGPPISFPRRGNGSSIL